MTSRWSECTWRSLKRSKSRVSCTGVLVCCSGVNGESGEQRRLTCAVSDRQASKGDWFKRSRAQMLLLRSRPVRSAANVALGSLTTAAARRSHRSLGVLDSRSMACARGESAPRAGARCKTLVRALTRARVRGVLSAVLLT